MIIQLRIGSSLTLARIFSPQRKRSVSEVQLMHNVWEHKHTRDRHDWLQMKLGNIHSSGPTSGARRGPLLLDLPDSKDLTPEQITLAMNLLEKVLSSRHSQ